MAASIEEDGGRDMVNLARRCGVNATLFERLLGTLPKLEAEEVSALLDQLAKDSDRRPRGANLTHYPHNVTVLGETALREHPVYYHLYYVYLNMVRGFLLLTGFAMCFPAHLQGDYQNSSPVCSRDTRR